jgi:hypothetical protein
VVVEVLQKVRSGSSVTPKPYPQPAGAK